MTEPTQPYQTPIGASGQPAVTPAPVPQPASVAPPLPPYQAAPPPPPAGWAPSTSPAPAPAVTAAPAAAVPDRRSGNGGVGRGTLLVAVLATAVLTSVGTYAAATVASGNPDEAPAALTGLGSIEGASPAPASGGDVEPPPATPAPATAAPVLDGSVVDVVKAVSPAVVTIVAEGMTSADPIFGLGGQGTATGSGVIFDADGLILTNRHVVSGNPTKLTVNLKDGRSLDGTIYGIDTFTDLAIVKVSETGLPTAAIGDSGAIEVGQQAIAIGSPLGEFTDSVTTGIVSAIGRTIDVQDGTRLTNLIQTDTAINPGNSGGPLLDTAGRVIGINTAVAGGAQGIGFAIPIDIAKPLLAQASAGSPLARAWLGVRFQTIDPALRAEAGLPVDDGAWIPTAEALARQQEAAGQDQNPFGQGFDPFGQGGAPVAPAEPEPAIVAGSPAAAAGLVEGDIITAVDGTALDAVRPLDLVVSQLTPGTKSSLDVLRGGQTVKLEITLGTRPASV